MSDSEIAIVQEPIQPDEVEDFIDGKISAEVFLEKTKQKLVTAEIPKEEIIGMYIAELVKRLENTLNDPYTNDEWKTDQVREIMNTLNSLAVRRSN